MADWLAFGINQPILNLFTEPKLLNMMNRVSLLSNCIRNMILYSNRLFMVLLPKSNRKLGKSLISHFDEELLCKRFSIISS